MKTIRQGDVLLVKVDALPAGCTEVPHVNGAIVLAFGEVTGHAHKIADHVDAARMKDAGRQARNALHAAKVRARLLEAPNGTRFLEVLKPVNLKHEEHSPVEIPAGIYELPTQMEHTAERMRRVAD